MKSINRKLFLYFIPILLTCLVIACQEAEFLVNKNLIDNPTKISDLNEGTYYDAKSVFEDSGKPVPRFIFRWIEASKGYEVAEYKFNEDGIYLDKPRLFKAQKLRGGLHVLQSVKTDKLGYYSAYLVDETYNSTSIGIYNLSVMLMRDFARNEYNVGVIRGEGGKTWYHASKSDFYNFFIGRTFSRLGGQND